MVCVRARLVLEVHCVCDSSFRELLLLAVSSGHTSSNSSSCDDAEEVNVRFRLLARASRSRNLFFTHHILTARRPLLHLFCVCRLVETFFGGLISITREDKVANHYNHILELNTVRLKPRRWIIVGTFRHNEDVSTAFRYLRFHPCLAIDQSSEFYFQAFEFMCVSCTHGSV